jgi:hypothetical protein
MSKIVSPLVLVLVLALTVWAARAVRGQVVPGQDNAPVTTETVQTLLEAADGVTGDGFGYAVASDGDLLAVSANYAGGEGAVYLYERDSQAPSGWTQIHKIEAWLPETTSYFGHSLALQGETLVVGDPLAPRINGFWQGRAYVFERNEGGPDNWGLVWQFADADDGNLRRFGEAVAIDGDLVAVSATGHDDGRGAVYLYDRTASWSRTHEILAPDAQEDDQFGSAVDLEGDTLLVGAQFADADAANPDTGAAYVFRRDEGGPDQWGVAATLLADPLQFDSFFGNAVDLEGDIAVVAADHEDASDGSTHTGGAAYVYRREGNNALAETESWSLLASLRPPDGVGVEQFGASVHLSGDNLWIGAPGTSLDIGGISGEGVVHHYGRHEGGSDAWGWLSTLSAFDFAPDAAFGSSLASSGASLLVGATAHDNWQGAVYDIVEGADPAASGPLHIPLMYNEWVQPTGVLNDGDSLQLPDGPIVGAVPGTLTEPLQVTIVETSLPSESLPGGFQPRGNAYRISSRFVTIAPADKPLLIGMPVPAGADPARLGVAAFVPDGLSTESEEPEGYAASWTAIPGSYDPATNLFVVTVRALLADGATLVLYEHPDNAPLPSPAAPQPSVAEGAVVFNVTCDPTATNTGVCTGANYQKIADMVGDAYHDFVNNQFLERPALIRYIGSFSGTELEPILIETYSNVVIAGAPCTNSSGDPIAGQYSYKTLQIMVCFDPNDSDQEIRDTVRHELFHAIQAAYPNVADDRIQKATRAASHWTVEGTASAAERSGDIMLRSPAWTIRPVTEPMTSTVGLREYEAQDFWVFTGLEGDQTYHSLRYLDEIFDSGATPEHVAGAMDLAHNYWEWAKNQAYEHYQTMDGSFDSDACELDEDAVEADEILLINHPDQTFVEAELPPLTSDVVRINIGAPSSNLPVFADTFMAPNDDLRYKVYLAGESGCRNIPDGERTVQNVIAGDVVYVLVSNVSPTEPLAYHVMVELD